MGTKNQSWYVLPEASVANNEIFAQYEILCEYVQKNWEVLFDGAEKMGVAIHEDYYAPERIQVNKTRLHRNYGVKYCDGVKYSRIAYDCTESNLLECYNDIILLVTAAKEPVKCKIKFTID